MPIRKILYIGYVWPEPHSSAAGSRTMEFLQLFRQQGVQVEFASPAQLSPHRADLSSFKISEKSITINCDSFDRYIQEYQPDVVMFDRFFTEEQFGWRVEQCCPHALRILDTCDLHSVREARAQLLKKAREGMQKESERQAIHVPKANEDQLYALMAKSDVAMREIASIYRCDWSIITSPIEVAILQKYFSVPSFLLHECNLMLPPSSHVLPQFEERHDFISIGNFRHAPNWDAVLWLKYVIWPSIRSQLPKATLHVVGAYPAPKAMELHNEKEGFLVQGWVEDAQQAMLQARVCLAPLRFGAGLKGKLFDAMTCGTPSVTTTIGSEGMHLPNQRWSGVIADTAQEIADAAVNLYQHKNIWQQAHDHAMPILKTLFDREKTQVNFVQGLAVAIREKNRRREDNFTGTMLRHHLHKSTQYMSQWIETKNKLLRQLQNYSEK